MQPFLYQGTVDAQPTAYEEVTVAAAAVGLAALPAANHLYTVVHFSGAAMRFTLDGTTPTPTVGHEAFDGDEHGFNRFEASTFRAIRSTTLNGTLRATHYTIR